MPGSSQELVVMVGLQGCGKTTWVSRHLAGTHSVVSDTSPEQCAERNAARDGPDRVPLVGVLATRAPFEPPSTDEGSIGWTSSVPTAEHVGAARARCVR